MRPKLFREICIDNPVESPFFCNNFRFGSFGFLLLIFLFSLVIANATFQAVSSVGNPEARIILSECAIYLATSPKSNASYLAIKKAQEFVRETGDLSVPMQLRNAPTKLMKDLGYGEDYKYAHDYDHNFVDQEFLPESLEGSIFYEPGKNKREEALKNYLKERWKDKYPY